MERERRLVKDADFARVHGEGKSWANRLLVLRALPSGREMTRVGFSVGKRVGKAVVRNRVKRMLREAVRVANVESGWDLVFIARAPSAEASFWQIRSAALELLGRARLLVEVPLGKGSAIVSDEEGSVVGDKGLPTDHLPRDSS